jgi:hypothetical protein
MYAKTCEVATHRLKKAIHRIIIDSVMGFLFPDAVHGCRTRVNEIFAISNEGHNPPSWGKAQRQGVLHNAGKQRNAPWGGIWRFGVTPLT